MTDQQIDRLDLHSQSPVDERYEVIRQHFPEAMREGKIDFEALQRSLGEWVDPGKERFGLNWPGKANCMRIIQQPSVGTLLPDRENSVDFDTTQNMIIEGDNLEVLKLLQKSYFGKVKMIYIDPPYNTGNDFVYPDDYREPLQNYLRLTGQVDDTGAKLSTNTDSSGRYHSNWLNMMHPRLFLARNLIRDDGVILVSIDDAELTHLLELLALVFGEENFIEQIIWRKRSTPPNDKIIGANHDYIVAYAKNIEMLNLNLRQRSDEQVARYRNPDNHPKGAWAPGDLMANVKGGRYVASLYYPIVNPNTGEEHYPSNNGNWRFSSEKIKTLMANDEISFGDNGTGRPKLKRFLSEVKDGVTYPTIWDFVPLNTSGTSEMGEIFGDPTAFESPKPTGLLEEVLRLGSSPHDTVLDFFAGSGTTGHAVMNLNAEAGGNRKYILVQLPELIDPPKRLADGTKLDTIADICRERLRRAGKQIGKGDTGFRAYKLAESNFTPWNGEADEIISLAQQVELFTENIAPDRDPEDLLTEILLKAGYELTTSVEWLTLAGNEVASVDDGALLVCLDNSISLQTIEAMAALDPGQIICLESGFEGDDQRKVNALQAIRSRARSADSTIAFKVV